MILQHQDNGQLVGEYRTAVEREPGSAGSTFSRVVGQYTVSLSGVVNVHYFGPSILRPLMGPRKCGLILQVVLK